MKIAWFSPFPPQKSGVSDYSVNIVYELKKYCAVDLWTDVEVDEQLQKDFRVINYKRYQTALGELSSYDSVIYNMGNNLEAHRNIYETLIRFPGTVILHDYVLNSFFLAYLPKSKYLLYLITQYGFKGLRWFAGSVLQYVISRLKGPPFSFDGDLDFPMNEQILEKAKNIIVHSNFLKKRIQEKLPSAEVYQINSPFYEATHFNSRFMVGKNPASPYLSSNKLILSSIGTIVFYKQLHKVIEALGKDQLLKERTLFYLIGQEYPKLLDLRKMIKKLGMSNEIKLLGFKPIETVYEFLENTDIFVNLRYPTLGETSAALLRAMERGKACIVTDTGWYSELPDNCVVKVKAPPKVNELRSVLQKLTEKKQYRIDLGENAKNYIKKEHSLELYIKKLMNVIEKYK